jgi:hypothetical protein
VDPPITHSAGDGQATDSIPELNPGISLFRFRLCHLGDGEAGSVEV